MDWQTKEYIDERLDTIEDNQKKIMDKLGIEQENDDFNFDDAQDDELNENSKSSNPTGSIL